MISNYDSALRYSPFLPFAAIVLSLAASVAGCASQTENDVDERVESTSQGLTHVHWRGPKKRGGSCKFVDDANGPADTFVIANGQDLSIVFTNLGAPTKRGPRGQQVQSACNFEVPLDVSADHYISGWHQTLDYGVVKPAGVAAGVGLVAALDPSQGATLPLPGIDVRFARDVATNIAFDTASADLVVDPAQGRHKAWRKQGCKDRQREITYSGTAFVWAERTAATLEPVIIAVDGVDARFDVGATVQACPANP